MSNLPTILEVSDLHVAFPTRQGPFAAVDGVSLQLGVSERLGLIGESGSGKSTRALALMRLIKPPGQITRGRIVLDGVDILGLTEHEMRQRRLADIALVNQGAMNSLNPVMRIRDQMIDAMQATATSGPNTSGRPTWQTSCAQSTCGRRWPTFSRTSSAAA